MHLFPCRLYQSESVDLLTSFFRAGKSRNFCCPECIHKWCGRLTEDSDFFFHLYAFVTIHVPVFSEVSVSRVDF